MGLQEVADDGDQGGANRRYGEGTREKEVIGKQVERRRRRGEDRRERKRGDM
jgi:hypothetical protein